MEYEIKKNSNGEYFAKFGEKVLCDKFPISLLRFSLISKVEAAANIYVRGIENKGFNISNYCLDDASNWDSATK